VRIWCFSSSSSWILDPALYYIHPDEAVFIKGLTKIQDDEELKHHILTVQKEAFNVFPYPCIHGFRFLSLKISWLPGYAEALTMGAKRRNAILLDLGCCFGNDARKAAVDGFPMKQVLASDIRPEFWELGNKLYKSDGSSPGIQFVSGDILDDSFVKAGPVARSSQPSNNQEFIYPELSSLHLTDSLNPLARRLSVIHASWFFHLFDEETQILIAKKLATLLSPEPGSIILGSQSGWASKGNHTTIVNGLPITHFCHSPES